jgi:hypothetical protein
LFKKIFGNSNLLCSTAALADACGFYDEQPKAISLLPSIAIDGPFGTSSEDLFRFEASVCVAAGYVLYCFLRT